jgi:hypothetical protein
MYAYAYVRHIHVPAYPYCLFMNRVKRKIARAHLCACKLTRKICSQGSNRMCGVLLANIYACMYEYTKHMCTGQQQHVWRAVVEEESGGVYFWNTITDETVWERPPELLRLSRSQVCTRTYVCMCMCIGSC